MSQSTPRGVYIVGELEAMLAFKSNAFSFFPPIGEIIHSRASPPVFVRSTDPVDRRRAGDERSSPPAHGITRMFPGRREGGISARGQRLNAVFCRSRSGDDGAAVGQAAALLLVDVEVIEQAAAEQAQEFLGGRRRMVGEFDRAAGPLVMTAGVPKPVDDFVEYFAGAAAQPVCAERQLHLPVENSRRQRPVDLVESDKEVGDLGDDVGLSDVPTPGKNQLVVQERVGQGGLKRGEVALGKLGVADLGQQVFISSGEEPDQGGVVERSGLTRITRGLRVDSIQQRRRQLGRDGNALLDQVVGHDRAGGPNAGADVVKENPREQPTRIMVVDHDLRHRGFAESPAGIRLRIDHHDGRFGINGHGFDRNQRDRESTRPSPGSRIGRSCRRP